MPMGMLSLQLDQFKGGCAHAVDAFFEAEDKRTVSKHRGGVEEATDTRFDHEVDQLMAALGESNFLGDNFDN